MSPTEAMTVTKLLTPQKNCADPTGGATTKLLTLQKNNAKSVVNLVTKSELPSTQTMTLKRFRRLLETSSVSTNSGCEALLHLPLRATDRLMKDWRAPVYGFFEPKPLIVEVNGRRAHDFICGARGCGTTIRRYLDKKDAKSTGNLRKHARNCWGVELMKTADGAKDATNVREALANAKGNCKDGSIKLAFEQTGKERVTYSHRAHTREETRYGTTCHFDY